MTRNAISVDGISKLYRIGLKEQMHETLGGALVDFLRSPARNFRRLRGLSKIEASEGQAEDVIWALKNISFDVEQGEVLGIIGSNGAGKSTLLKILAGITEPSQGRALVRGRVSSLLEVGTGFHPELTGRENVYLNGTILGMTKVEIDRKFDEIVEFSGVEKFIDTPVKRYSSGMRVRLAFAVAAHLEPEVLLIDEVLAVGDAAFQKKCLGVMGDVARLGRTVLFVSHNMAAVAGLCDRVISLRAGAIEFHGLSDSVIPQYVASLRSAERTSLAERVDRTGSGSARIERIGVCDRSESPLTVVLTGAETVFEIEYSSKTKEKISNPWFEIKISDGFDRILFTLSSYLAGETFSEIPGIGKVKCAVESLPLVHGLYEISVVLFVNGELADLVHNAAPLQVIAGDFFSSGKASNPRVHGPFLVKHSWNPP